MDGVKIRVSSRSGNNSASSVNKRRLQKSTTLNRRFVKKPTPVPRISASAAAASRALKAQNKKKILITKTDSVKLTPVKAEKDEKVVQPTAKKVSDNQTARERLSSRSAISNVSLKNMPKIAPAVEEEPIAPVREHKVAKAAKARMTARRAPAKQNLTAQELKDRAIRRAMQKVAMMDSEEEETKARKQHFWKKKHFALGASLAAIALVLLGYLVSVNMPDISVRVAAMQTGIEKVYPGYVPASYRLDGLVKEENGRITMAFKNDQNQKFTIIEEKSSWDSAAVLSSYVIKTWGQNYSVTKGQGLTIYISGSNAAWVNGGVFYSIISDGDVLSSADLHDIAVSL